MTAQQQSHYLTTRDGTRALVDSDVYERAKGHTWGYHPNGGITATIKGVSTTLGRFIMNETDRQARVTRIDTSAHQNGAGTYLDFRRANLKVIPAAEAMPARRTQPTTPPATAPVATPPLVAPATPAAIPQFIDLAGNGIILSVLDIASIDCTDPDIVIVERRTQQYQQAEVAGKKTILARDTCAVTYAYEGAEATRVRSWARELSKPGACMDEIATLRGQLAGAETATRRAYEAEGKLEKLRAKLRGVGFDVDKLLAE